MLTSLEIQNFKAFRHLKIEKLAKVNLFVGESNTGKTALLEAIHFLPHTASPVTPSFRTASTGSDITKGFERWLYHDLNTKNPIKIIGESSWTDKTQRTAAIRTIISKKAPQTGEQNVQELSSGDIIVWSANSQSSWPQLGRITTSRFSAVELARAYDLWIRVTANEDRIVEFARAVEPDLRSLRNLELNGTRMLHADVGLPERIALPLLGEGLNRLIEIYGAIIGEGADIVLIDEIENGLHWKALPKVWQGIKAVVDAEDVQIFATTHSIECINAAMEVFKGQPLDDLAVHRLERRDDGDIHCITMDEETLARMLERGWEVR
jgi:AAA15 family ATPase/GTPase